MNKKTFSKQDGDNSYFGSVTFTEPASEEQDGQFFCEAINSSSLRYYTFQTNVTLLQSLQYQQIFNILGHNTNRYTLVGHQLRIDSPTSPGVQVIVVHQQFDNTDDRLTTLAKLTQKQLAYVNSQLAQLHTLQQEVTTLKGHVVNPNQIILRVTKRYWRDYKFCFTEIIALTREPSGWIWKSQCATDDKWITDVNSPEGRTVNMNLWGQTISYTMPAAEWRQISSHDVLIETVQYPW